MLSILIPVYNYDVTHMVNELINQVKLTKCSYEIIILDDCSTVATFLDKNKRLNNIAYCSYKIQDHNQGRTKTRLNLAKMAKYNWLLFLDADVVPARKSFMKNVLKNIDDNIDIIFGGVQYESNNLNDDVRLRWLYGRKKEVKNVVERNKNIYTSIISQNFVIQKKICLEVMEKININRYGLDILFSYELEQKKAKVLHIDNPTIHLGLENNYSFFKKSMASIDTTLFLQKNLKIPENYRPIQRAHTFLKKSYSKALFFLLINSFENPIINNITSSKPNMLLFDLYRLYYFIKIQK